MSRILVVGRHDFNDEVAIGMAAISIKDSYPDLASRLLARDFEDFDMSTRPEKGDVLDAIVDSSDVGLVVALHLFGISRSPTRVTHEACGYLYDRNNFDLLPFCMRRGIVLICWGDQPWYGVQLRRQIHENQLWIYEPRGLARPATAANPPERSLI